jgi:DNA invertase Pin-like site-specific DNA recombinase
VSGSIAPQDRDDLGPWLTDRAKLAQWDILCVAKLDRLTRSVRHFDNLRIWADEHGKGWVTFNDEIVRDDEGARDAPADYRRPDMGPAGSEATGELQGGRGAP